MKKIRVGIIGQGRSGRDIHSVSLERPKLKERFELAAVADRIPERCSESCANHPGCRAYTDYRELLKDSSLDLIVNATQSPDHVGISIEALEAGHAVLSEKPLARHVADVDRVLDAAKRTGQFFAIFQQSRFAPAFRKVREVMNSGILGRIVMVKMAFNGFARRWDWQTLQEMCAGNLLNTGPHPLDQQSVCLFRLRHAGLSHRGSQQSAMALFPAGRGADPAPHPHPDGGTRLLQRDSDFLQRNLDLLRRGSRLQFPHGEVLSESV